MDDFARHTPQRNEVLAHLAFLTLVALLWEGAADKGWLDPTFFGRPSGIAAYLW